jgi:putative transposase
MYKVKKECTFIKDNDRYYICIPSNKKIINLKPKYNTVALDPGIRTFQTFYSPDGVYGFLGKDTYKRTAKIGLKFNKVISILDKKQLTVNV